MKSTHILLVSCLLFVSFGLLSTSCSSLRPYQPTQYQGSEIDQEKINQIQIGFTKSQIVYLIGQPALTNTLSPNIWQYVYTKKTQEKLQIKQNLVITFDENGQVEKIEQ
ncbi:outer membrane protein assembly factor BamE [Marinicellulosiphila megalodicopiae]|uniref:outer membrane protein assembly factor BamE n=1 Tax=Marinicellulosiphila megalodicopiae TaxID=2724896 RepID=UPI003BAE6BFA